MAEPFVPSTQDIRECYAALGSGPSWDERVKEFDRWLSQLASDVEVESRA